MKDTKNELQINEIISQIKLNVFLWIDKNKELVKNIYTRKDFAIIQLDLWLKEFDIIDRENQTWKKLLERFLFFYNQVFDTNFENVSYSSVIIDNITKVWNCIIFYNGNALSDKKINWYRKIALFHIKTPPNKKETNETFELNFEEKTYFWIKKLLNDESFSVRNVFKLWVKQYQARLIYNKASELKLFEISKDNPNQKTYFTNNFTLLTKQVIFDVLNA